MYRARLHSPIFLAVALFLPASMPLAFAQAAQPSEYAVKAAFLLNFTRFIQWPIEAFESAESPLELCILGKDPFGSILNDVADGEMVNGRKLVIRRIPVLPTRQSCQAVFIDSKFKDMERVLMSLESHVLTVSEGNNFLRQGGMISLVVEARRVRFDVNQSKVEKANLKASSQLLNVARSVAR